MPTVADIYIVQYNVKYNNTVLSLKEKHKHCSSFQGPGFFDNAYDIICAKNINGNDRKGDHLYRGDCPFKTQNKVILCIEDWPFKITQPRAGSLRPRGRRGI